MARDDESTDRERRDDVQDAAERRQHERAETTENVFAEVRRDLGEQKYPVTSEELGSYYADDLLDLPNETESLGSVFRRIDDRFEDADAAYEAFVTEFGAEERFSDPTAAGTSGATADEGRSRPRQSGDRDVFDEEYASSDEDVRRRASEAQADAADEESTSSGE